MTNPAAPAAAASETLPDGLSKDDIRRLRALPEMGEIIINGELWTKFTHNGEYKVSPNWEKGDYDTGCCWVAFEDI
jgi:hypothetical protein